MKDERGAVLSAELVLILTVCVVGLVAGLTSLQGSLISEFNDIAGAIHSLNQSYGYTGFRGCVKPSGYTSWSAGSTFYDRMEPQVGLTVIGGNTLIDLGPGPFGPGVLAGRFLYGFAGGYGYGLGAGAPFGMIGMVGHAGVYTTAPGTVMLAVPGATGVFAPAPGYVAGYGVSAGFPGLVEATGIAGGYVPASSVGMALVPGSGGLFLPISTAGLGAFANGGPSYGMVAASGGAEWFSPAANTQMIQLPGLAGIFAPAPAGTTIAQVAAGTGGLVAVSGVANTYQPAEGTIMVTASGRPDLFYPIAISALSQGSAPFGMLKSRSIANGYSMAPGTRMIPVPGSTGLFVPGPEHDKNFFVPNGTPGMTLLPGQSDVYAPAAGAVMVPFGQYLIPARPQDVIRAPESSGWQVQPQTRTVNPAPLAPAPAPNQVPNYGRVIPGAPGPRPFLVKPATPAENKPRSTPQLDPQTQPKSDPNNLKPGASVPMGGGSAAASSSTGGTSTITVSPQGTTQVIIREGVSGGAGASISILGVEGDSTRLNTGRPDGIPTFYYRPLAPVIQTPLPPAPGPITMVPLVVPPMPESLHAPLIEGWRTMVVPPAIHRQEFRIPAPPAAVAPCQNCPNSRGGYTPPATIIRGTEFAPVYPTYPSEGRPVW